MSQLVEGQDEQSSSRTASTPSRCAVATCERDAKWVGGLEVDRRAAALLLAQGLASAIDICLCGQHAAALRASAPKSLFSWGEIEQSVPGSVQAVAAAGEAAVEYAWELSAGRLSIGSGMGEGVAILAFQSPTAVVRGRMAPSAVANLAKSIRSVGRAARESKHSEVELAGTHREWAVRLRAESALLEFQVRDSDTNLAFTLDGEMAPEVASKFEQVASFARRRR